MPLSTIFQFYKWRKLEYADKTTEYFFADYGYTLYYKNKEFMEETHQCIIKIRNLLRKHISVL
jgi:hypothetical protein